MATPINTPIPSSTNFTPANTPVVREIDDDIKLLDIMHNGKKIGVVPDTVPDEFDTDAECSTYIHELKALPNLSSKHKKTLDNCLTILSKENHDALPFGPTDILLLSELAFRYPDQGIRIMSLLQYLMSCLDFEGSVPDGFYGDVGAAYAYLGSLPTKTNENDESNDFDDDDQFGFDLGDSLSQSDEEYDDEVTK